MNLVGVVSDGATPIQGVVVSDGYSVTATDKDGVYQIAADKRAKFVFVSVPADCEIPIDGNNFPKMYQTINPIDTGKMLRYDFTLKKTKKVEKFTLLAFADVQIQNSTDLDLLSTDIPKIKDYVKTLVSPVYGISLGDQVWDNMPYMQQYAEEMGKIGIPVFPLIGNHDHNQKIKNNDEGASSDFETNFGPTYYSYNIGDCHFVVLDDILYNGRKDYTGEITKNQLDWLREDLKYIGRDKLIIVALHIPTKRRQNNSGITNAQALYDILEGYKVRILSGHAHYNFATTISDKIEENSLGSVMGAGWSGDLCSDGSPRGYGVYEIDGNNISSHYYKGTNHERNYQMYLYNMGDAVSPDLRDGLIFNIFAWHTTWTVKVYEDNVYKTTLTDNIKEKDRRAFDYMDGPDKPVYRPGNEPTMNNDHMFYYKPSSESWSTIRVEAIDPYGNVYTQSINR